MTINANNLILQVNSLLVNNSLSNTELDNTIIAAKILENKAVNSKPDNQLKSSCSIEAGKLAFNETDCRYYHSDGTYWQNQFGINKQFSLALTTGLNQFLQLGDGTTVNKCSPVSVVGGFTDWQKVSSGSGRHSLGIRNNGTLWSWGYNCVGELGDGTGVSKSSPVSVLGGFTDWCYVDHGERKSAAIRKNGTLWLWGCNNLGSFGNGNTLNSSSPVSVIGGFTDWCQVSTGLSLTLAVRQNGTLWSWGQGTCGRLGDGTTAAKSSPVSVIGGFTDWCQVSNGNTSGIAVRQNGTLWSWGRNQFGQLGDGTTVDKCSPVSVIGGFTDWCQVAASSSYHSVALRSNGTLWSWGNACCGKLGDGTTVSKSSPVSVVGGFTDWCDVKTGSCHNVALRTNGTMWTWGNGCCGALGNNNTTARCSPVSVFGGITTWFSIGAGDLTTIGLYTKDICPYST